jgi:hypothetical protein
LAAQRGGERRPLEAASRQFENPVLLAAVQRLAKTNAAATPVLQREYDSYYYLRHGRGNVDRPLPILRVDLDDAAGTRFYLDPQDGRLLLRQDQSRRVYRWLYSALHHWDFGWLYQRPVWDVWMLTWVGFGLVLSISSLVLGWKLLVFTFRSKKHAGSRTRPASVLATETQVG